MTREDEPLQTVNAEIFPLISTLFKADFSNVVTTTEQILTLCDVDSQPSMPSEGKTPAPFLYDQAELSGLGFSKTLTYCIKRLLRGLASAEIVVKLNFATALKALCIKYKELPFVTMVKWLETSLSPENTSEIHKSVVNSGLILGYRTLTELDDAELEQIIEKIAKIWKLDDNVALLAQESLIQIFQADEALINWQEVLAKLEGAKISQDNAESLNMSLFFKTMILDDSSSGDKIGLTTDPESCLKDLSTSDSEDLKLVSLVYSIFLHSECRIKDHHAHVFLPLVKHIKNAKALAFLMRKLLFLSNKPLLTSTPLSDAFANFLQHRAPLSLLSEITEKTPDLMVDVVERMISFNGFNVRSLLYCLNPKFLTSFLEKLQSKDLPDSTELRIMEILSMAIKTPPFKDDPDFIRAALTFCLRRLVESSATGSIERIRDLAKSCCLSYLSQNPCDKSFASNLAAEIDHLCQLDSPLGKKHFDSLDKPIKDAWKACLKIETKASRKKQKSKGQEEFYDFILTFNTYSRILLLLDPICVVEALGEILEMIRETKVDCNDLGTNSQLSDVIFDVMIQWVSRPSALLRFFAEQLTPAIAKYITSSSIESINQVLKGQFELENEEEEEEDLDDETGQSHDQILENISFNLDAKSSGISAGSPQDIESQEWTNEAEEEINIDLDTANEKDLELLDSQLSAIMALRRKKNSIKSEIDLVHFKQRVCSMLILLLDSYPSDNSYSQKLCLISGLVGAISLHANVSKKRQNNSIRESEMDLLKKISGIISKHYQATGSKIEDRTSSSAVQEQLSLELLDIFRSKQSFSRKTYSDLFDLFRFAILDTAFLDGCVSHIQEFLRILIKSNAAHPGASSFLQKFICHHPGSIVKSLIDDSLFCVFIKSRFFARDCITDLVARSVRLVAQQNEHLESYSIVFKSFLQNYTTALSEPTNYLLNLPPTEVKKELDLLHKLLSSSLPILGHFSEWGQIYSLIQSDIRTIESRGAIQKNLISAIRGKWKTCTSLLANLQQKAESKLAV